MIKQIALYLSLVGCATAGDGDDYQTYPPPDDPVTCQASPDTCDGQTICLAGRCEPVTPRVYALTWIHVSLPPIRPSDGDFWDPFGGAPDPFLGDRNGVALTAPVKNASEVTFAGPLELPLTVLGQTIELAVWDDDEPAAPDGAFICRQAASSSLLRSRTLSCVSELGALTATLQPAL